jgi:hypothetical protein
LFYSAKVVNNRVPNKKSGEIFVFFQISCGNSNKSSTFAPLFRLGKSSQCDGELKNKFNLE